MEYIKNIKINGESWSWIRIFSKVVISIFPKLTFRFTVIPVKIFQRRKWQPTPVFLPGKSHGQRSLAGYNPWGHQRVGHNLVTQHTTKILTRLLQIWTRLFYNLYRMVQELEQINMTNKNKVVIISLLEFNSYYTVPFIKIPRH